MELKKILKKIYYFILWNEKTNYDYFSKLDILLIYLENVKIIDIIIDDDYCKIKFSDGTKLRFSNEYDDRWKSWMKRGVINFYNGKTLDWSYKRPSREILYKFKKLILEKEKLDTEAEINGYLPISLVRKQKLKNIKK